MNSDLVQTGFAGVREFASKVAAGRLRAVALVASWRPVLLASMVAVTARLATPLSAADDRFAGIPTSVAPFVEQGEIAGAVMAIADKEHVLHLSAVGQSDLATGRAMQTNDLFWIASMTKPITAIGIGMLVDDRKVRWDDPLEKYIPEFKNPWVRVDLAPGTHRLVHVARAITLRDLLTHTSGVGEYTETDPHWTLEHLSQALAKEPLRFQPGDRWAYSTAGTDLLSRVIEIASGMSFADFLQRRLFDPLGMKDTTFWISPEQAKRLAHDYRPSTQPGKLEETVIAYMYGGAVTDRARPALGGAGLFSTAEDIIKVYQMMLRGGTVGERRLLTAATVAELTHKHTGDLKARPGMPWGYGFCVIEDPAQFDANRGFSAGTFGHGGAHGTQSWADPSRGLVYVFMIQRDKISGNPDNSPMRRAYQVSAAAALGIPLVAQK